MPPPIKSILQASAIVVRKVDNIPALTGIYGDLLQNESWLVAYTTWLNSTLGSNNTLFTPGNMLLFTTGTIVMGRLTQNKMSQSEEASPSEKPEVTVRNRGPPTTPPAPKSPAPAKLPVSKEVQYKEEVARTINSFNMIDEHSDYTLLE